jgi:Flp pilus assembly protein TadD
LPLFLLLVIAGALWIYRKKVSTEVWVALALIIAPLLPVLNLRVFHFEYIVQDRYLYLPSIGFAYLVALFVFALSRKQTYLAIALTILCLAAFGISTFAQNRVWHDSLSLWRRAVYYSPNSWSTHYNLGLAYLNLKQFDNARNELSQAAQLNHREPTVFNNLALAEAGLGNKTEAINNVRIALALDPQLVEAHNNLGAFLFDQGAYAEAEKEFRAVLDLDPSSVSARFNLGRTLAARGYHASAIAAFEAVLKVQPKDAEANYQLGLSYAASGRKSDAIAMIERAMQLQTNEQSKQEMQKKLAEIKRAQ